MAKRIILIEDDPYFIDDEEFLIINSGFECKTYRNVDDFINAIDTLSAAAAVVLDIMIRRGSYFEKDHSKYETGELIYNLIKERYPLIPIIVVSAKNKEDIQLDDIQNNKVLFFQKPFDRETTDNFLKALKGVSLS